MNQPIKTYEQVETFERDGVTFKCVQHYSIGPDGLDFVDGEMANQNQLLRQEAYQKATGISKKSLATMDEAVANLKQGKVSEPVDLSEFEK